MAADTAILVLAAGASKRLGTPKQLLPYNSSTLLQDTVGKLMQVQSTNIYVVLGAHYQLIAPSLEKMPVTVFQNKDWEAGMSTTISKGITQIQENSKIKRVLITLVDLPLLEVLHYNALLETHCQHSLRITITQYLNSKGVPCVFDRKYFRALAALKGDEGAKPLIRNHKSDVAFYKADIAYYDVDTMEDYLKLIAP